MLALFVLWLVAAACWLDLCVLVGLGGCAVIWLGVIAGFVLFFTCSLFVIVCGFMVVPLVVVLWLLRVRYGCVVVMLVVADWGGCSCSC